MKKFINKFEKQLMEVSLTTVGGGLNTGDAWPDGIFTKYGERRQITPAGMPRGMVQVVAPAADSVYGGDGSQIPEPDLGGGTFKRTKITPEYIKSNEVINPHELRDDTPPLAPKQRVYGRRAFGKSPDYTIPRESADFVFTGDANEKDILVKPTTPPEGSKSGGIPSTPEPGSKALGSKSGYRQVQKGGESILHDLDKLYIDKMLGKYDPKKEGISEGSLPTKVKQVKKTKGVKPPNAKKAKEFFKHHVVHNGPHIQGKGAEHATYDFDDDDYEVDGGLQKRKDKQKRGYEPVESVNERKNPKREKLKKDFKTSLKFVKGVIRKIDTFMKSNDWGVVDGFVTNKRTGLASLVKDMEKSMNQIIKLPVDESVNEGSLDWEKNFKWANEKELKVIAKVVHMSNGIAPVIKMSKKKDFKPFIKKAAQKGLGESVNEAVEPTGNIKKVLDVAKNKQAKKIGGTLVDGTTANMMTQVWNKVNDSSKEKMNKMNTKQLINLILRMWKAMGTPRV